MFISGTQFTLGNNAFEIYVSGCKPPHCPGCHNPELWEFNVGTPFEEEKINIEKKIKRFNSLIDKIMIFGGDLNDQILSESIQLLDFLKEFNKEIWLFTRFELEDIDINILKSCDYIKTGRYLKEFSCTKNEFFGINLSTSNQKIYSKEEIKKWISKKAFQNT